MRVLFLFTLPLLLLAQTPMQTRTQILMGTYASISLPQNKQEHSSKAFHIISNVEHALSTFSPKAHLYRLNDKKTIPAHTLLKDAIQKSMYYYEQTQGYFDITVGSLTKKLYHFGEDVASPSTEALQGATLNIKGIHFRQKSITLDENITLDLGGMGKGYAVDKVANYFKEQNITEGRVALSGDIRCLNRCELFLQSPFTPFEELVFAKILTKQPNVSISTSGTYRRYAAKKEEHHLIDPKKRVPEKNFVSVSLFSLANNSRLDAFATAVSVMPKPLALSFLNRFADISFILVETDGTILYNDKQNLLDIEWIPYKEDATIQTNTESKDAYTKSIKSLTHPNISHPIEIKR